MQVKSDTVLHRQTRFMDVT
uniref:Uncharacterized protein n=1 Tax=Arundo donax TaxID=35708 RepID=A0A0A9HMW8_ARUDO